MPRESCAASACFSARRVQRDGPRLFAVGVRDAAVQPPQRGQQRRRQRIADLIGRTAEHRGGAVRLALHQPRFGQRGADDQLVLPLDPARLQQRLEQLGGGRAAATLEQRRRASQHRLEGRADHRAGDIRQRNSGRPGCRRRAIACNLVGVIESAARPPTDRRRCACTPPDTPTPARCAPATRTRCASRPRWASSPWPTAWADIAPARSPRTWRSRRWSIRCRRAASRGSRGPTAATPDRDDAANELAHAVRAANARVVEAGERDPELSGMGTTLTALALGAGRRGHRQRRRQPRLPGTRRRRAAADPRRHLAGVGAGPRRGARRGGTRPSDAARAHQHHRRPRRRRARGGVCTTRRPATCSS